MEQFTVKEFQNKFDELFNRVENGESFRIVSEHRSAIIVPYKEVVKIFEDHSSDEELIRIHTDHEEGT